MTRVRSREAGGDRLWIVLPVKGIGEAKQRLAPVLAAAARAELCRAMLEDVLTELGRVRDVAGVLVASNDPAARALGERFPVTVILEPEGSGGGLNGAVSLAVGEAVARGATSVMVLHGDLPLVDSGEIERLWNRHRQAGSGPRLTLVPDDGNDGTNVLVATPPHAIPFAYGVGSFARHRQLAADAGIAADTFASASLALDIDTPADLERLAAHFRRHRELAGRHTARLLAEQSRASAARAG